MPMGYSIPVEAIAVTAAQDFVELNVAATKAVRLTGLRISQTSDYGDAAAEGLQVKIIKGYTSSGSGGSAVTPVKKETGFAVASSTAERNNTSQASGGTPLTLLADSFNVQIGFQWSPQNSGQEIWLAPGERAVVTITAPADSLTMNGVLEFEEYG